MTNDEICKWLSCLMALVLVVLAIIIYDKVAKCPENFESQNLGLKGVGGRGTPCNGFQQAYRKSLITGISCASDPACSPCQASDVCIKQAKNCIMPDDPAE